MANQSISAWKSVFNSYVVANIHEVLKIWLFSDPEIFGLAHHFASVCLFKLHSSFHRLPWIRYKTERPMAVWTCFFVMGNICHYLALFMSQATSELIIKRSKHWLVVFRKQSPRFWKMLSGSIPAFVTNLCNRWEHTLCTDILQIGRTHVVARCIRSKSKSLCTWSLYNDFLCTGFQYSDYYVLGRTTFPGHRRKFCVPVSWLPIQ